MSQALVSSPADGPTDGPTDDPADGHPDDQFDDVAVGPPDDAHAQMHVDSLQQEALEAPQEATKSGFSCVVVLPAYAVFRPLLSSLDPNPLSVVSIAFSCVLVRSWTAYHLRVTHPVASEKKEACQAPESWVDWLLLLEQDDQDDHFWIGQVSFWLEGHSWWDAWPADVVVARGSLWGSVARCRFARGRPWAEMPLGSGL